MRKYACYGQNIKNCCVHFVNTRKSFPALYYKLRTRYVPSLFFVHFWGFEIANQSENLFMNTFSLYFNLGIDHILDIDGIDHIIFIFALCAIYQLKDWRKVLILVTAFTLGHSITLALSIFDVIRVKTSLVEFLIPVTIFITSVSNLFKSDFGRPASYMQLNYAFAGGFGLIHGMGFANALRGLLGLRKDIGEELFAFNLGIEVGQIAIVAIFLFISFIFIGLFGVSRKQWNTIISAAIAGISVMLMIENKFW
ncbi:HupE/UreJ family protein [Roseivirga sp. BDSF3-8]|uniref:HupE/UreJ family protein n=1 Tax=Roseivirga sp. BDSF3-8 TaxID=3241598 RepID=UPI0035324AF9